MRALSITIPTILALAQQVTAQYYYPADGFHLGTIMARYSGGCPSADSLRFNVSAQSMDIDYYAMGTDASRGAAFCVMLFDLSHLPMGWRFAIDSVTYTGHAQMTGGSFVEEAGFFPSLTNSWILNPQDDYHDFRWKINGAGLNSFQDKLSFGKEADYDQDFSITATPTESTKKWSPCFVGYSEYNKVQLSIQNYFYLNVSQSGYGYFGMRTPGGPALRTKAKLIWQQCDPLGSPFGNWGSSIGVDSQCVVNRTAPEPQVLF